MPTMTILRDFLKGSLAMYSIEWFDSLLTAQLLEFDYAHAKWFGVMTDLVIVTYADPTLP